MADRYCHGHFFCLPMVHPVLKNLIRRSDIESACHLQHLGPKPKLTSQHKYGINFGETFAKTYSKYISPWYVARSIIKKKKNHLFLGLKTLCIDSVKIWKRSNKRKPVSSACFSR